jgi:hypothetical protein
MNHGLTMIIYRAMMGIVGSIVTAIFQLGLARREDERRHIHLPTHKEVMAINAGREKEQA